MDLHCPSCNSSNTQNIEVAYEQSVRTSHKGFESVSAFGRKIAPPEFVNPLFAGFIFALVWVVFWFIGLTASESYRWFQAQTEWHVFMCDSAIVVFVIAFVGACLYDVFGVIPVRARWRKGMVCRRCGHVWLPRGDAR